MDSPRSPERIYLISDKKLKVEKIKDRLNLQRHLARYEFAAKHLIKDGVTLDVACGSGYGSVILSRLSKQVLAFDRSRKAICFARKHHGSKKIIFFVKDIKNFRLNFPVDSVVILEAIEHIEPSLGEKLLFEVASNLRKGGRVIISSPILRYSSKGKPFVTNPFHVNEMPKGKFKKLIRKYLSKCQFFAQHQSRFRKLRECDNKGFCVVVCS